MGITTGHTSCGIAWQRKLTAAAPDVETLHVTLEENEATDIVVGDSTTDIAVIVNYCADRGTDSQMGAVFILNNSVDTDQTWEYQNDDIGITITSSLDAGDIIMTVTVDNSSVDSVIFDYIIELITL